MGDGLGGGDWRPAHCACRRASTQLLSRREYSERSRGMLCPHAPNALGRADLIHEFFCTERLSLPECRSYVRNGRFIQFATEHHAIRCYSVHAFCRGNGMKNPHVDYVEGNDDDRRKVVEPVCEPVKFLGEEVDRHDPHGWQAKASLATRDELANVRFMNMWR